MECRCGNEMIFIPNLVGSDTQWCEKCGCIYNCNSGFRQPELKEKFVMVSELPKDMSEDHRNLILKRKFAEALIDKLPFKVECSEFGSGYLKDCNTYRVTVGVFSGK